MGRRAWIVLFFACGCARTGLRGGEEDVAFSMTCRPGDAPVVLASVPSPVDALATDGTWLYVVQKDAPTLWSIPTAGGSPISLEVSPVSEPCVFEEGVYVDDAASVHGGVWIRHDGLEHKEGYGGVFAPPFVFGELVPIEWGGASAVEILWSESIENGETNLPFYSPAMLYAVLVSDAFVHGIGGDGNGGWVDVRFDRATANVQDVVAIGRTGVPVDTATSHLTAGAAGICVQNACILDDDTEPVTVALDPDAVLALDERFAYGQSGGQLVRVGIHEPRREVLADFAPQAVALASGCIYAASPEDVVRLSPSE